MLSWLALGGLASGQTHELSGATTVTTGGAAADVRVMPPADSRSGPKITLAPPSPALVTAARASVVGLIAAEAADIITTARVVGTGRARETNPLLPQSATGITAVKLGLTAGLSIAFWKLSRTHPRTALIGAGFVTAITAAGAIHNAHIR